MNLVIGLNSQFGGHGILSVAGGFKHLSFVHLKLGKTSRELV